MSAHSPFLEIQPTATPRRLEASKSGFAAWVPSEGGRYNPDDPTPPCEASSNPKRRFMIPVPLELCLALAPALCSAPAAPAQTDQAETQEPTAPALDVLSNSALLDALTQLAQDARVELSSVARSRGGRAIQALKISGESASSARPAILLVAGLDGPRTYTSSMALDHARRLAQGYGQDQAITQFLDTTTVYVIPRFDVDAAAARFTSPLAEVQGTGRGVDNDRDGRQGEDAPSDVNGDGFISTMRVLDPEGEWIIDPTDVRAMRKADRKAGERGLYKLYSEGYDSDDDERVAEDPALDAVVNRNFPRNWSEHTSDAGRYPTDEPGVLGLVEFVLDHTDLALVLTYGEQGNLVEKPKTQKDAGPSKRGTIELGVFEADADEYVELGKRYAKLTGNKCKGVGEQPGSFQGWMYHDRGLFTLNIDPWEIPLDAKAASSEEDKAEAGAEPEAEAPSEEQDAEEQQEPKPSDEAKRLLWLDQNEIDAFLPWTSFDHPQLGTLEVGGFKPYSLVEPRPARLGQIAAAHFEHLLSLGELLPRPQLELISCKLLGSSLYEVKAVLTNEALLPLTSHAASRTRTVSPLQVHVDLPAGAELVAGEARTLIRSLDGVGGRHELRWLISLPGGPQGAALRLVSKNAGQQRLTLEVK